MTTDLQKDNWYYVQIFTGLEAPNWCILKIVFADTPTACKMKVNAWLDTQEFKPLKRDINLYHKNYKRDAKTMVSNGNFII